jgi:6,7-dimethyl-8-ribityllumazine synthase
MPNYFDGNHGPVLGRIAIVVSRYNDSITTKLLNGAVETLLLHGVEDTAIDVAWVPGAFELPLISDRLASGGGYAAVICLGAVIRGETTHDEHINRAVSLAMMETSLRSGVPVIFGVLTCESLDQAIHRAGGNLGNKGVECAQAAIEMVRLLAKLPDAN